MIGGRAGGGGVKGKEGREGKEDREGRGGRGDKRGAGRSGAGGANPVVEGEIEEDLERGGTEVGRAGLRFSSSSSCSSAPSMNALWVGSGGGEIKSEWERILFSSSSSGGGGGKSVDVYRESGRGRLLGGGGTSEEG